MAEVVLHSLQHLTQADLRAIVTYLKSLPQMDAASTGGEGAPGLPQASAQGADIYDKQCADCHGTQGEGVPGAYPALAGNRAVQMARTVNLVQVILYGGFAPATQGNPRPFGMPPFKLELDDRAGGGIDPHPFGLGQPGCAGA